MANEHLDFFKPPTQFNRGDLQYGDIRYFADATINASYNCLDRHDPQKEAIRWERDEGGMEILTFGEVLRKVCQLANAVKTLGNLYQPYKMISLILITTR